MPKDDGSRGVFFHSMNPAATRVLKDIHADIWSIGNNHTMDAGREGVLSTKKIAEEMGCLTMGAGMNDTEASEPVYLDEAGGIGMFCVAYQAECIPATATEPGIFRWDDLDLIAKRIAEIKSRCRWCVIVSHGGEEFTSLPSPYTRDRYLKFLNSEPMWSSPIIPMSRKTTSSLTTEKQFSIHSETSFLIPTISESTCIRMSESC